MLQSLCWWKAEISFGDTPNSSSIDILKPCAIFDYIGAFLRSGFAHVDNVIPVIKTITWLLLSTLQGNKHTGTLRNLNLASGTYANTRRNFSEPSGTFRTLPPEPTPTRAGTLRNPPEPSTTFRNQPFGTFWNLLPPEPPPAYTGTLRNLPEPSGNLPPEPTPLFYTGTLRNLPQPASLNQHTPEPSGTFLRNCSCDPHRHTPELIWAEDPISFRCWGKNTLVTLDSQHVDWRGWRPTQEARICPASIQFWKRINVLSYYNLSCASLVKADLDDANTTVLPTDGSCSHLGDRLHDEASEDRQVISCTSFIIV